MNKSIELHDENCIFCKIVAKNIPSTSVYEDENIYAFNDIHPWAPVHFLIIPKKHIASMAQITANDSALMGEIMTLVPKLALQAGCNQYPDGGFRIIVNTGREGGQEVDHLHIHVIGGTKLSTKN
jgi:histidine triad (HIT) family protein